MVGYKLYIIILYLHLFNRILLTNSTRHCYFYVSKVHKLVPIYLENRYLDINLIR